MPRLKGCGVFKGAFIFCCGIAAGVLLYDGALERATVKAPRTVVYAAPMKLAHPIEACAATVDGQCYRRGLK